MQCWRVQGCHKPQSTHDSGAWPLWDRRLLVSTGALRKMVQVSREGIRDGGSLLQSLLDVSECPRMPVERFVQREGVASD